MKLCKTCNLNDRYITPKGQKTSYCKPCNTKRINAYHKTEKGKESLRRYQLKYFNTEKGRHAIRKANRKSQRRKNGFTPELFGLKLAEQNYKCAICYKDINESSPADHDHDTGLARGILCVGCNTLLGRIEKVGFDWVDLAKQYLQKYK